MRTNIMEQHTAQAVDGLEMLACLSGVVGVVGRRTVFDTEDLKAMQAMIRILLDSGYRMAVSGGVELMQDDMYALTFVPLWGFYPYMDHYPYWIKLRYVANGMPGCGPRLVLAYRQEDDALVPYDMQRVVSHVQSDRARSVERQFEHDFPETPHVWVPVFGEQWQML